MTPSKLPAVVRRPDEPSRPDAYCPGLASFLDRRANAEFALVSHARKPSNLTRDAAMLGGIYWLRGQSIQNRT